MAGTNLNFPYDAEIFNYTWRNTPDMILTTMIESGAVAQDGEIATMIANGSNFFTVPYYDVLGGTEQDYDGVNDFTFDELAGGDYSGCVYSRMKAWSAISFIKDFNSGADPMSQIIDGVAQFWIKARQTRLLGILAGVFGISGDADWDLHTTDIASVGSAQIETVTITAGADTTGNANVVVTSAGMTGSPKTITVGLLSGDTTVGGVATKVATALTNDTAVGGKFTVTTDAGKVLLTRKVLEDFDETLTVVFNGATTNATASASVDETVATVIDDTNLIGATSVNDASVKANGDNASAYSLVIMHSVVANRLANLQLLEYSKYTDASGITRNLPIGTINGKTVIVNDSAPKVGSVVEGYFEYTTYILGLGAIRYASAPVDIPSEMERDAKVKGGVDMVYTRLRECLTPYGFSFKGDVTTSKAVPDSVLLASGSYERIMPAKSVFMTQVITNG
jgi:hypothetical protein